MAEDDNRLNRWKTPGGVTPAPRPDRQAEVVSHPARRYEAFKAVDKQQKRLHIRGLTQRVYGHYSHLPTMTQDMAGEALLLNFGGMMVITMRGKNLDPVADAIADEHCEFVQQYDPARWDKPEAGEPFIETIEFFLPPPPVAS